MFKLVFSSVVVFFVDPPKDFEEAGKVISDNFRNIMFIDIPQSNELFNLLKVLKKPGRKLIVRNRHWDPKWADQDLEFYRYIDRYQSLVGHDKTRSCTELVIHGESYDEDKAIVSNITIDGLFATLKAIGTYHPCIDLDSRILCGRADGFISNCSAELAEQFQKSKHDQAMIAKLFDDFAAPLVEKDYSSFSRSCVFEPARAVVE